MADSISDIFPDMLFILGQILVCRHWSFKWPFSFVWKCMQYHKFYLFRYLSVTSLFKCMIFSWGYSTFPFLGHNLCKYKASLWTYICLHWDKWKSTSLDLIYTFIAVWASKKKKIKSVLDHGPYFHSHKASDHNYNLWTITMVS